MWSLVKQFIICLKNVALILKNITKYLAVYKWLNCLWTVLTWFGSILHWLYCIKYWVVGYLNTHIKCNLQSSNKASVLMPRFCSENKLVWHSWKEFYSLPQNSKVCSNIFKSVKNFFAVYLTSAIPAAAKIILDGIQHIALRPTAALESEVWSATLLRYYTSL